MPTAFRRRSLGEIGDLYDCPAAVAPGDFVYLAGSNSVDRAFAGVAGQTDDAFGFVRSKPSATRALVVKMGRSPALFSGLTPGQIAFLSITTPGAFTTTPPTGLGINHQRLGRAVSATELDIEIREGEILAQ